ncbi:hypothetical protein K2P97_10195 [bacterium]|nr:hypothetical protein [bacterium]
MKINKNDRRLTAYVLNELDISERNLIEKAIQADPELKNEVLLLQKTVGVLLKPKDQEHYRLSPEQRDKIFPKTKSIWSMWPALGAGLVTASLALIIFNKTDYKQQPGIVAAPPAVYSDEVKTAQDIQVAPPPAAPAPEKLARTQKERAAPETEKPLEQSEALGSSTFAGAGVSSEEASMLADSMQSVAVNELKSEDSYHPSMAKAKTAGNLAVAKKTSADSLARVAEWPQKSSGLSLYFGSKLSVEPVVTEAMNSNITKDLTHCWSLSLSNIKLIGYNYTYQAEWSIQSGKAININWTASSGSRAIGEELRQCWTLAIQKQNWQGLKPGQLIYELNIVSK